jgi:hypothetical protein
VPLRREGDDQIVEGSRSFNDGLAGIICLSKNEVGAQLLKGRAVGHAGSTTSALQ